MRRRRTLIAVVALCLPVGAGACRTGPPATLLAPVSLAEAEGIVNANVAKISGTLRAAGAVDGFFTDAKGRRYSFHLDGVLFYLAPSYFRFDLKKFGDRQLLLGSNEELFWVYSKRDEAYHCGRRTEDADLPPDVPIRPDQVLDALGLSGFEVTGGGTERVGRVQRVVHDHQQVLFLVRDDTGQVVIEKEYWLDRYAPRLVRRVVFRDRDGVLEMVSDLDSYRAIGEEGLLLPDVMTADWPGAGARMRFRISKWSLHPQVGPDGPQFAAPTACSSDGR